MRLAPACALLSACAGAPTPAPAPAPPRAPFAAALPIDAATSVAASACLPDSASSARVIDGDLRAIHVCFDSKCVAIARRTGAITAWPTPAASSQEAPDVRVENHDHYFWGCAGENGCFAIDRAADMGAHAFSVDASRFAAVVGIASARSGDPPIFVVRRFDLHRSARIALVTSAPCGHVLMLDATILVASDACATGPGTGSLFDLDGHFIATLSTAEHPVDAYESTAVALGGGRWAIVSPWSYAVEILDLPLLRRRDHVGLVPLQVTSTDHPSFAALADDGALIVASPSGGVGVIDLRTSTLASTWIVPRCDSAATAP